jgi:diaminopimelate decarboxylase
MKGVSTEARPCMRVQSGSCTRWIVMPELLPDTAEIGPNGHLIVGGVDTVSLAQEWGTPLYVYDETTLRGRCQAYVRALAEHYPVEARVCYAAKAFLCTGIARLVAEEGLGLDVVSGGELYIAGQAGIPGSRIHFHGNSKSRDELLQALDAAVHSIVVDNMCELRVLSQLADQRNTTVPIWLRISPNVDADTHVYRKTGLLDSKFGFPLAGGAAANAIRFALSCARLLPIGLHAHVGSQIADYAPFLDTVDALLGLAADLRRSGFALQELSPGGGLAVQYVPSDPAVSIDALVQQISARVSRSCARDGLPLPRLVLEPGRSIVGPACVALYTIGARKEIPGVRTYVSVDGGMSDNPRPALYGARYTALLANKADLAADALVTVAGKLCESGDLLVRDVSLPDPQSGDILAVPVSGAYQLAMSSNYNQALRPAAVLVHAGKARPLLRRETFEDLTSRDV